MLPSFEGWENKRQERLNNSFSSMQLVTGSSILFLWAFSWPPSFSCLQTQILGFPWTHSNTILSWGREWPAKVTHLEMHNTLYILLKHLFWFAAFLGAPIEPVEKLMRGQRESWKWPETSYRWAGNNSRLRAALPAPDKFWNHPYCLRLLQLGLAQRGPGIGLGSILVWIPSLWWG